MQISPLRAAAFAALMALSACAADGAQSQTAQAPDAARDCFNVNAVSGFDAVDGDTLRVSAGASRRYELDVRGPGCNSLDWTENIALESRASEWLCAGDGPNLGQIHYTDTAGFMART
nr:DUF6491 family protein [Terricaulis sp.]